MRYFIHLWNSHEKIDRSSVSASTYSQSVSITDFLFYFSSSLFFLIRSSSTTSMANWFYCEKCLNQKWIEWSETSMKTENYKLWFRTFKFKSLKVVITCVQLILDITELMKFELHHFSLINHNIFWESKNILRFI